MRAESRSGLPGVLGSLTGSGRYAPDTLGGPADRLEGAACAAPHVNPEWFFTADVHDRPDLSRPQRSAMNKRNRRAARGVCHRCPVRDECLKQNITVPYGIFGGLSPDEREALAADRGLELDHGPDFDPVAVELAIIGVEGLKLRKTDRFEIVRRMTLAGATYKEIERVARINGRYMQLAKQAA